MRNKGEEEREWRRREIKIKEERDKRQEGMKN